MATTASAAPAGDRALRRIIGLAAPVTRVRFSLAVLASWVATASGISLVATSALLISKAALRPPVLELTVLIVGVRAFALSRAAFRYLERLETHGSALLLLTDLRTSVYDRLERVAPAGLGTHRVGDLLSRLVSDVDSLQGFFVRGLGPPLVSALAILGTAIGLWLAYPAAALLAAAALSLAAVALTGVAATMGRAADTGVAATQGMLATEVAETLLGAPEVIAFGNVERMLARIGGVDARLQGFAWRRAMTSGLTGAMGTALSGLAVCLALAVAIPAVRAGKLDGVLLALIALAILSTFDAVTSLPAAVTELQASSAAARRVFEVIDQEPPVSDPLSPMPKPQGQWLELQGARLRYGPDQPWALDDVDLRLEAGRRIGLVGPSGAGKTTLANVLLRFRDLDGGIALLDGHDLRAYAQTDVRRVVGLLSQDAHLFNSTILENIRLARPAASIEEMEDACRRAQLLDWIRELPNGWRTRVGEAGAQVSGGQRQRIALARVILAGFPILVADEPTAHLDRSTADALLADLVSPQGAQGLLLITHQLTGLESLDEIVLLDAGRVVERGSHEDLVAGDTLYHRLLSTASPQGHERSPYL
jgi:thiol reductant ABC exporter CydC subunit